MKRSEHLNVVAGKYLDFFPLSVNGLKYVMYRVREDVAFEHWASRGFKYDEENNTLCPISYELTDNSYVFYCSDEPVSVLANWKIGTYGFAKNKFRFIVPFHKFNPDNIGESLQHNVVKQQ